MPRRRTGTLERRATTTGDEWHAKLTLDGGKRKRVFIGKCSDMTEARARETAAAMAERAVKDNRKAVDKKAPVGPATTVEQFGTDWTSGALLARYGSVNRLKTKKSSDSDRRRLARYLYPILGKVRVADVTEGDIDRVMADVRSRSTKPLRPATVDRIQLVLHRLFDLAIMPGRLRKDNPVTRYHKPAKGPEKLYGYLFPAEFEALLKSPLVPTERKVFYCIACYVGLRKGSIYGILWSDVDQANGVLRVRVTKTDVPLLFEVPRGLLSVLAQWRAATNGQPGDPVVPHRYRRHVEATILRTDLLAVGVERFATKTPGVEPLRAHDLRATFVTWAKRAGKGDGWISDRTGHMSPEMINRYARQARTLADLRIEPFADLEGAIPELVRGEVVGVTGSAPRTVELAA